MELKGKEYEKSGIIMIIKIILNGIERLLNLL